MDYLSAQVQVKELEIRGASIVVVHEEATAYFLHGVEVVVGVQCGFNSFRIGVAVDIKVAQDLFSSNTRKEKHTTEARA